MDNHIKFNYFTFPDEYNKYLSTVRRAIHHKRRMLRIGVITGMECWREIGALANEVREARAFLKRHNLI